MELWTGKQLFSVLLRPEAGTKVYLNLAVRERGYINDQHKETMCPNDRFVYIRNSELLSGQLGKATLGNDHSIKIKESLIMSFVVYQYECGRTINQVSFVTDRFLSYY